MIRRVACCVLLLAVAASATPVRRAYRLSAAQVEQIRELARSDEAETFFAESGGGTDDLMAEGLRYVLHELDAPLPKAAPVRWNRVRGEFIIEAEDDLHTRIGRALSSPAQWQIEINASLIAVPLAQVEQLARAGEGAAPANEALRKLWAEKGGHLIASTKLLTRSGNRTSVFAGDEIMHAGEARALAVGALANAGKEPDSAKRETVAVGTSLVLKRIGLSVEATPTLETDLQTLGMRVAIDRATATGQRSTALLVGDGAHPPQTLVTEVPTRRAEIVSSEVWATDGIPLLLGGWPAADAQNQIYLLLTPRVIDAQGLPRAAHDFRGRLLD